MKLVIEKLSDLRALYIKQLRVLLSAEELIVRGIPRMIESAADTQLKQAFQSHLQETEAHATRIREILDPITDDPSPFKCKTVMALIDETEDMIEDSAHESVRDAALIATAQRIEHYEIAAYGAVRHFAKVLGLNEDTEILNETAQEEGRADRLLTGIAERINPLAQKAA
jgi:ferritin-like metal-binding protein YciE